MKKVVTRAAVALSAVALIAGSLSACSNGSDAATGSGGGSASNAKIGLLLPDSVTARFASADRPLFTERIKSKCPDCKVLYQNAGGDASKQQQQAQAMLTQGVKVLVLDAFDGEAAASIVSLAKSKNVPVISYDRLINSGDLSAYISFDNNKVGELQATALVKRMQELGIPDDAGILEVNGSPTDNNASQFKAGAQSVLSDTDYEVLGEYDTPGWDPAKAQSWASGQISKVGVSQVKGIYAANDDTAGGVISAMQAAGATEIPPITGQDATLAGLQRILAGKQYMTVYKAFKPEAEGAADLALQLAAGKKADTTSTVKTADGKTVPSVILTPVAVTADNIKDTVVKDGLFTADQICTSALADACAKYGIN